MLGPQDIGSGMQLAITDAASGHLLGDLYIRREEDILLTGYTIAPSHARQGFAYEAMSALITWAQQQNYLFIRASVEPGNTASIRLLEKLGFTRFEPGSGSGTENEYCYQLTL